MHVCLFGIVYLGECEHKYSTSLLYKSINLLNLTNRIIFQTGVPIYKAIHKVTPEYIWKHLTYVGGRTRAASRQDLVIPKYKLSIFKRSFRYNGPLIWNQLKGVRDIDSLKEFKLELQSQLMKEQNCAIRT